MFSKITDSFASSFKPFSDSSDPHQKHRTESFHDDRVVENQDELPKDDDIRHSFLGSMRTLKEKSMFEGYYLYNKLKNMPTFFVRACLILTIGITVGVVEYIMTTMLTSFLYWKFSFIQFLVDNGLSQILVMFIVLPIITAVSAVVCLYSPMSAGSSLPEIKGCLNGAYTPGIFSIRTTVVKAIGVILVITCGFPVGREGPMVQIGCAIASQIVNLPIWSSMLSGGMAGARKDLEADKIMREKTLIVTIGGAAGIATVFRSPIGGVLYMMEDMASYWSHETTVRSFACCMISTLVFSICLQFNEEHSLNLINFDSKQSRVSDWQVKDLPWFALVGIFAGTMSSIFSEGLYTFQRVRRLRLTHKTPKWRIFEVFVVSAILCSIPLYLPSAYPCLPKPSKAPNALNACFPKTSLDPITGQSKCNVCSTCCNDYLELSQVSCDACVAQECKYEAEAEAIETVKYNCEEGEYNQMATLWLMGEEGVIKLMYAREDLTEQIFSVPVLLVFLFCYMFFAVNTGGLVLPFGTFVPNLLMGAAGGRMIAGIAKYSFGITGLSSSGTYALIGAASQLGGYTRMTLTVVVMLVESSGDVRIVIPLMLSVQLSRTVANMISECYDEKMMELRLIPFLHDEPLDSKSGLKSSSLMAQCTQLQEHVSLFELKKLAGTGKKNGAAAVVGTGQKSGEAFIITDTAGNMRGLLSAGTLTTVLQNGFSAGLVCHEHVSRRKKKKEKHAKKIELQVISGGAGGPYTSTTTNENVSDNENDETPKVGDSEEEIVRKFKGVDLESEVDAEQIQYEKELMLPLMGIMDPSPYTVLEDFPLGRLFPIFRKLRIEHVVVLSRFGKPIGLIHKASLIEIDAGHVKTQQIWHIPFKREHKGEHHH